MTSSPNPQLPPLLQNRLQLAEAASGLPVVSVVPQLLDALANSSNAVLVAPPGAGKTTLVPLALLDAPWVAGRKIIMLEPRRLAARAAAHRMATLLGEKVGETVGHRIRFDTKVSAATRIEVVTEGVFTRLLAADPGLEDVAAVLFDEFHERSLDGDLALALSLDVQAGLNPELRLLPMSATLDGAAVSDLLDAPLIESAGRSFPVETVYREHPSGTPLETMILAAVREALADRSDAGLLVFLPGQREIERSFQMLTENLPAETAIHRLYGSLSREQQDAAIAPAEKGRAKVVLASAIAETSLTLEGITTVIDSGLSRLPVFEPATGLTRLQTVRASKAAIAQRAGRAGRLGPGRCIRLWREQQTRALPDQAPPEMLNVDLTDLALILADWGVSDPGDLRWLDNPPMAAMTEARKLLVQFDALSADGKLTQHGRAMRKTGLPPRFAHMVVKAAQSGVLNARRGAQLAFLVQEQGLAGRHIDLTVRSNALVQRADSRSRQAVKQADRIAASVQGSKAAGETLSEGVLLGYAFPDRIAQRGGQAADGMVRYRLANGRGAMLDPTETLATSDFLVVADMAGQAGAARILSAAPLTKKELLHFFSDGIEDRTETRFDRNTSRLEITRSRMFGGLVLSAPRVVKPDPETAQKELLAALQDHGLDVLPWRDQDRELQRRLNFIHEHFGDAATPVWRDCSEVALLADAEEWIGPFLVQCTGFSDLAAGAITDALMVRVGHPSLAELAKFAPTHFEAPSGSRLPLSYEQGRAILSVRPQELFGLKVHPMVGGGRIAVELELVSPAGRPIQITRDLPGFWQGSWRDVRADLRGRYPKHPWPEDPANAVATARAKPRK